MEATVTEIPGGLRVSVGDVHVVDAVSLEAARDYLIHAINVKVWRHPAQFVGTLEEPPLPPKGDALALEAYRIEKDRIVREAQDALAAQLEAGLHAVEALIPPPPPEPEPELTDEMLADLTRPEEA